MMCPEIVPARQPNPRQWRFAALLATGALSLSDCFRAVYGRRQSRQVEWSSASRLAASAVIRWAVARIAVEAQGATRLDKLQTRSRIHFADAVLRAHARRVGRISERERDRRAEQQAQRERRALAWQMFAENYLAIARAKGGRSGFLTPQQRTEIVFAHFAPIAVPEPVVVTTVPPVGEPTREEVAELKVFLDRRQTGIRESAAAPEVPCLGSVSPSGSISASLTNAEIQSLRAAPPIAVGRWEVRPIAGRHPPRWRRVWIPPSEGEDS
jgi:hypothetical protein